MGCPWYRCVGGWLGFWSTWQWTHTCRGFTTAPGATGKESPPSKSCSSAVLPHDRVGRKTYKYALTVVDVASRYKEAEPLTSKGVAGFADALSRIYKRGPLKWPKLLQVDPGREFMGAVSQLIAIHTVEVRRGRVGDHRDQGIVERWNRTLSERLFGHQYAQEMRLPVGERSTEWVRQLPAVVSALNGEVTRLTGKRPSEAIRVKSVSGEPSSTVPGRPVGLQEQKLPSGVGVRFLYQPGELDGGRRRPQTLCGPSGCTD